MLKFSVKFSKKFIYHYYCVCERMMYVCVCYGVCNGTFVEVRGQFCGAGSHHLPFCGFWGLTSHCQASPSNTFTQWALDLLLGESWERDSHLNFALGFKNSIASPVWVSAPYSQKTGRDPSSCFPLSPPLFSLNTEKPNSLKQRWGREQ